MGLESSPTSGSSSLVLSDRNFETTSLQQIVASSSGAVITSLFVTPLDVVKVRLQKQVGKNHQFPNRILHVTPLDAVKVRLQSQRHPLTKGHCFLYSNGLWDHLCTSCVSYVNRINVHCLETNWCPWYARPSHFSGTFDAFAQIARKEGIWSLWSGLPPTLVMAVPATACYFTLYDTLHSVLKKKLGQSVWVTMTAGSTARIAAVVLISPLEMVRTKMQSQRLSYFDIAKAVRLATAQNGLPALWQGLVPTLLRDVPFSAFYWAGYEKLKADFLILTGRTSTTFSISFVAGAISGAVAALITLPFDVIKTHRQIEIGEMLAKNGGQYSTSTWHLMKRLCREHGIKSLFTGAIPRLIKVAPACAIMIGTYEFGKAFFYNRNKNYSKWNC